MCQYPNAYCILHLCRYGLRKSQLMQIHHFRALRKELLTKCDAFSLPKTGTVSLIRNRIVKHLLETVTAESLLEIPVMPDAHQPESKEIQVQSYCMVLCLNLRHTAGYIYKYRYRCKKNQYIFMLMYV